MIFKTCNKVSCWEKIPPFSKEGSGEINNNPFKIRLNPILRKVDFTAICRKLSQDFNGSMKGVPSLSPLPRWGRGLG
jgi:hypothetical protein